jgi:hypothetical protein
VEVSRGVIIILGTFILLSCNRQGKEGSHPVHIGEGQSITIESSGDTSGPDYLFPDTLVLKIDSAGKAGWQKEQADLQKAIQDSLISLYLHKGKLPSHLEIQYSNTISENEQKTAQEMIRQARIVLINVISVKELDQSYNDLDEKEKEKFRKQYPLLFPENK